MCINIHTHTSTFYTHIIHIHPPIHTHNWNTHNICRFVHTHLRHILRPAERFKVQLSSSFTLRVIVAPFYWWRTWGSERFQNIFEVMELGNNRVWTCTQVCLTLIELHLHSAIPIRANTHTHRCILQTCPCSCLPAHPNMERKFTDMLPVGLRKDLSFWNVSGLFGAKAFKLYTAASQRYPDDLIPYICSDR